MSNLLYDIAKQETAGSPVIADHEKISTSELILKYPDGVHLCAVDMINGDDGSYPVFNFTEDESKFYSGGVILTRIVNKWLERTEGDLTTVNDLLAKSPLHIKLQETKTKTNRDVTRVVVVG